MRLLYVIDSLITGGAESSLAHVAPSLTAAGVDLHIAYLKDRRDLEGAMTAAGATLHPVTLGEPRVAQLRALTRTIRSVAPDIVHTTLWESDVLGRSAAMMARIPVVTTFASAGYSTAHYANPDVNRARLHAAQLLDAATCRFAHRFHAVSQHVADDMATRLWIPRSRIEVIPRARDRARLGEPTLERRTAVRSRLRLGARPTVLAVARHEHEKGIDVLMTAATQVHATVPDVKFLVAGRSSRSTALINAAIERLGLFDVVDLLGRRDDVPDLMVGADVVVVPSRTEGFPGVVLEAMALERPVIASDLPSVREAITDHAYALVPVGDSHRLADAIVACLRDPGASRRASAGRRHFDRTFTPQVVAARMLEFYARALRRPEPRRS